MIRNQKQRKKIFEEKRLEAREKEEVRAGRGWWILGGCQQQQHNRIRKQNEGNRKDVMQTDGYLPHVLCARDHIGDIS